VIDVIFSTVKSLVVSEGTTKNKNEGKQYLQESYLFQIIFGTCMPVITTG
jgi:hypothetical protein